MERILTKEEIAELLTAVQEGEIDVSSEEEEQEFAVPERKISRLDLTRTPGQGQRRIGNLDILLDAFAQSCSISMTNRLQRSVGVKREEIETMPFERLLQNFSGKGAIGIMRLDPLRWGGLLTFDASLSFYLVEILLGAANEERLMLPDRALTAIEMHVVKGVLADACQDLGKALHPLEKIDASLAKVERDPRLVNIVQPDAQVLVTRFKVNLSALSGEMTLVIPYASLDPFREKLHDGILPFLNAREGSWRTHAHREVLEMDVTASAQMGTISLTVREILNLQEGDVLELGCDPGSALQLLLEGKPKYSAQVGVRNGNKAVRILSRMNNGVGHGKET